MHQRVPAPQDASLAISCPDCKRDFGLFLWRHLCRACGFWFCDDCTQGRRAIPKYGYTSPERVCNLCEVALAVERKDKNTILQMNNMALLRKYAALRGIDLTGCLEKADVVRAIVDGPERQPRRSVTSAPPGTVPYHPPPQASNRHSNPTVLTGPPVPPQFQSVPYPPSSQNPPYPSNQHLPYPSSQNPPYPSNQNLPYPSNQYPPQYSHPIPPTNQPYASYPPFSGGPTPQPVHVYPPAHPSPFPQQTQPYPQAQPSRPVVPQEPIPVTPKPPLQPPTFNGLTSLRVPELRQILERHGVRHDDCLEKDELIAKIQRIEQEKGQPPAPEPKATNPNTDTETVQGIVDEENLCVICMDGEIETVFLECGHMACCRDCAKACVDCPLCRRPIARVVNVFHAKK